MTTWQDISNELSTLFKDPNKSSYPEELRKVAFKRACEYFAVTHTAPLRTVSASATAYAEGVFVSFPSDFLELPGGGVQIPSTSNSKGRWLQLASIIPGGEVPENGYISMSNGIYLFDKTITAVTLWYYGQYTVPSSDSTIVDLPPWSFWAVINLTAANSLFTRMMAQANLRQFSDKRDAGDPEDNPPRKQAEFFYKIYNEIVSRFRTQDRSLMPL